MNTDVAMPTWFTENREDFDRAEREGWEADTGDLNWKLTRAYLAAKGWRPEHLPPIWCDAAFRGRIGDLCPGRSKRGASDTECLPGSVRDWFVSECMRVAFDFSAELLEPTRSERNQAIESDIRLMKKLLDELLYLWTCMDRTARSLIVDYLGNPFDNDWDSPWIDGPYNIDGKRHYFGKVQRTLEELAQVVEHSIKAVEYDKQSRTRGNRLVTEFSDRLSCIWWVARGSAPGRHNPHVPTVIETVLRPSVWRKMPEQPPALSPALDTFKSRMEAWAEVNKGIVDGLKARNSNSPDIVARAFLLANGHDVRV